MNFVACGYCPLHKRGLKGLSKSDERGVLGAMPSFVLLAVLGSAIAVSVVLVMYVLVRR
jgi:hypothetical protein